MRKMSDRAILRPAPLPLTPATPIDFLAALALSPGLTSGVRVNLPEITLTIPSSPGDARPTAKTAAITSGAGSPSITDSIMTIGQLHSADTHQAHRPLMSNEVRQIVLLINQHFKPLHHDTKGFMHASIELAEQLHEAGIRRGRRGRVMGTHLRGIWDTAEEGVLIHLHEKSLLESKVSEVFESIRPEPQETEHTPLPIPTHLPSEAHTRRLSVHGDPRSPMIVSPSVTGNTSDIALPNVFKSVHDMSLGSPDVLKRRNATRDHHGPKLTVKVDQHISYQACRSAVSARTHSAAVKSALNAPPTSASIKVRKSKIKWRLWKRGAKAPSRRFSVGGWEVR